MSDWMDEDDDMAATEPSMIDQAIGHVQQIDNLHWGLFLAGIIVFMSAKVVAHRAVTFYATGAVLGVVCSFLFLAMFIRRFLPKRIFMIPTELIGGPALGYLYYHGFTHAQQILHQNWKWLALYVTAAAVISLIICYVSDVSSNVRIRNVLQWSLQFLSVLLMIYSSQSIVMSTGVVLLIVSISFGAHRYLWRFVKWLTGFGKSKPSCPRLTMKEYQEQGAEYTRKELEKLRLSMLDNCRYRTPDGPVASKCRNRKQLASFLMTSQDVSIQSQLEYQKEYGEYESENEESLVDTESRIEDSQLLTDDEY